jgi:hypothetical protein
MFHPMLPLDFLVDRSLVLCPAIQLKFLVSFQG